MLTAVGCVGEVPASGATDVFAKVAVAVVVAAWLDTARPSKRPSLTCGSAVAIGQK